MDVWDAATGSTTETLVTCSINGVMNQTINPLATTCASGCEIATLYDQVGTACVGTGTACNITNTHAGTGSRPRLILNATNSKACMQILATTTGGILTSTNTFTQAQPFSMSAVANRTGQTTTASSLISNITGGAVRMGYGVGVNLIDLYAGGTDLTTGAGDSAYHALGYVANAASSSVFVDSSQTLAGSTIGANAYSATTLAMGQGATTGLNAMSCELGILGGSLTPSDAGALASNQQNFYGLSVCVGANGQLNFSIFCNVAYIAQVFP
jgi:hypothetical protein